MYKFTRHFISYPKSGRTWVRYALTNLGISEEINFHHDGFEFNNGDKPPLDFDLCSRLIRYTNTDKVVYLDRDPRDVMVSLFFQITGRFNDFFNYQGNISQFIRDEYFGAENLARFRTLWKEIVLQRSYLTISYERCHEDMGAVLKDIMEYYELDFSASQVSGAIIAADFTNMKKLEASETFPYPWLRPRQGSPKVRLGKVGGFHQVLNDEDIQYLNKTFLLEG